MAIKFIHEYLAVQDVLWPVFCQAQEAMEAVLGRVTVEDICKGITSRCNAPSEEHGFRPKR